MAELNTSSHFSEEQLIWFFYGEAENAAEIDVHLSLCRTCRAEYQRLKATMASLSSWSVPARGAEYGQTVWRELVRRDASIASGRRRVRWRNWLEPRKLAAFALSACLVMAAFFAGRVTQRNETAVPSAAVVRERLLAAALTDHLDQSERTLLEITNATSAPDLDLRREQQRAEMLLQGNRLYRQTAESEGHTALASVLEDLERVLVEVAHVPDKLSAEELQQLRSRVEDQQLLFRLRVLNLRLRELQEGPVRSSRQKI